MGVRACERKSERRNRREEGRVKRKFNLHYDCSCFLIVLTLSATSLSLYYVMPCP